MAEIIEVSNLEDKVLGWVVDWLVKGIWDGVQTVVSWILTLFDVAIIDPLETAGDGVLDAFRPVGDTLIDGAWSLSDPMRTAAAQGPFSLLVVSFLTGVVLVVVAYGARGAFVFVKTVTWK